VIMMILTQAIASVMLGKFADIITKKMDELKPKDIQTVQIRNKPDGFSITLLDDVSTTSQKWKNKDNADLQFENELSKESILKEISVIPNNSFKTKGKMMITVDDSLVFQLNHLPLLVMVQNQILK